MKFIIGIDELYTDVCKVVNMSDEVSPTSVKNVEMLHCLCDYILNSWNVNNHLRHPYDDSEAEVVIQSIYPEMQSEESHLMAAMTYRALIRIVDRIDVVWINSIKFDYLTVIIDADVE